MSPSSTTQIQLHLLAYAQQRCGHDHTPEPGPCTNHSAPAHFMAFIAFIAFAFTLTTFIAFIAFIAFADTLTTFIAFIAFIAFAFTLRPIHRNGGHNIPLSRGSMLFN